MKPQIPERAILPVTVGTAGHIDHGKTTLLRALAGGEADTDRLAEERDRGLTIDVGYAELSLADGLEVGVVDVPGHEKFVRNMVAGAMGIDVVLLVVAADDGVMPQTREHLDIMSLLGLESGVVALTKADTVDEEMVELVRSETEDLLQGTFLEGAKIIAASGVTGEGTEELREEIGRLVRAARPRDADGFFRMPILRVFTSQGFGTIVTGIPVSGRISIGDRVEIQPGGRTGRVRGLQVYHRAAEVASAGHRSAINVAELTHKKVARGDVVSVPGVFDGARLLDVRLRLLETLPRPVRHNQEVRLHVGTTECAARVLLLGRKRLEPGETAWAQLKLDREVVTAPGDRFIVRLPAQLVTLGGGVVLGPGRMGARRRTAMVPQFEERARGLEHLRVAVESCLRRAGLRGTGRDAIVKELKRRPEEIEPEIAALAAQGKAVELSRGLLIHGDEAEAGERRIVETIQRSHDRSPLALAMRKALLADAVSGSSAVVDGLVERLCAGQRVEQIAGGRIRVAGWSPALSDAQRQRCEAILDALASNPWQTPRSSELPNMVGGLPDEVDQLLALLEEEGHLARLRDGVLYLATTIEDAKTRLREYMVGRESLAPADLKKVLGISRKYGIPLLEHLDQIGFTRRTGDTRVLR